MIHESFQNVRSFAEFAAVPLPATLSTIGHNDKVRFWNILVGCNDSPVENFFGSPVYSQSVLLPDFNVSRGSMAGSFSKLTKLLRFVTQNRNARISAQASTVGESVMIRINQMSVYELIQTFQTRVRAAFRGRGRTNVDRPSPSTRANRLRAARLARMSAAQAPRQNIPSTPRTSDGSERPNLPDGRCDCDSCRQSRVEQEAISARENRFAASIQGLLAGFEPWAGMSPSVFPTLLLDAVAPGL